VNEETITHVGHQRKKRKRNNNNNKKKKKKKKKISYHEASQNAIF